MVKRKNILLTIAIIIALAVSSIIYCNYIITTKTSSYLFSDVKLIPECKTGLLLGTSKHLKNGSVNLYFKYRIDAATELYRNQKIKLFIVSGDNSVRGYNEPQDMKDELMKKGIPDSVIFLDYAGFRTYDSVIRINKVFGQSKFIIISQKFHNERAVYIARDNDMEAFAFNAKDVNAYYGFKTKIREYLARVKVFTDKIINRKPKFLGDKISIK